MRARAALGGALVALLLAAVAPGAAGAAPEAGPVSGRVVGPDGTPWAGAVVELTPYGDRRPAAETTTAADGTFELPGSARPAAFVLVVCSDAVACDSVSHATQFVKTYVGPGETAFTLPALHGFFTTDLTVGSSPAVDVGDVDVVRPATIRVVDHTGQWFGPNDGTVVSGMVRHYGQVHVFDVLAPGTHEVVTGVLHRTVTVGAGETRVVRFGTRPAIAGRVTVGGHPVRGEPVVVALPSGETVATRTHRDGRYRIGPLPPGERLTARTGALGDAWLDPGDGPKRLERLILRPGEVRDVSVAARRGSRGAIAVTVPPGTTRIVSVRPATGPKLGRIATDEGRARTGGLAPGRYTVATSWTTRDSDGTLDTVVDRESVRVRAGRTARVHLTPPSGPGEVTVHADPGSFVRLSSASPDHSVHARVVPDTGEVRFAGLTTGDYEATAARDQYAAQGDPVPVRVGRDPVTVTVPAPPAAGSVRLRLVDPDTGTPWPWTTDVVRMLTCAGSTPLVDGGYFTGAAEPGTYRGCSTWGLWVDRGVPTGTRSAGVHAADGTFVVRPGEETTADLEVDLTP